MSSDFPTVVLFGSRLHRVTLAETCDAAEAMIRAHDRCYLICVKDVGLAVRSRDDEFLRGFYEDADLVVVDGQGLVCAAEMLGRPLPGRVGGPDVYREMLRRGVRAGYGVYLLGAKPDVVVQAARRLQARAPGVRIVGWHHGYFGGREADVVADIVRAKPDILFVGISTPVRERFLDAWRARLPPCVCIPVGGMIDVEAGVVRLAPRWVSRAGMEWVFRVMQEPRRLVTRYARTHSRFAILLAAALLRRAFNTSGQDGTR